MMIKATKVNGVYDKDPVKFNDAVFIPEASYDEIITKNLRVMDQTAIALAKENGMKLKVVSLYDEDAILRAVLGKNEGTLIS
jgi:uridylate kinase